MEIAIHPLDLEQRRNLEAKRSDGLLSEASVDKGIGLNKIERGGQESGLSSPKAIEDPGRFPMTGIGDRQEREQGAGIDEDTTQLKASSR